MALCFAPVTPAEACGPDFDVAFLSQRTSTMAQLPGGVFAEEVKKLVPVTLGLYQLVESNSDPDNDAGRRDGGTAIERNLYDKGAAFYHKRKFVQAAEAFDQVLALAPKQRQYRSTWAAYMRAKSLDEGTSARDFYQLVRKLARDGYRDDLGLAVSSLGQEARLNLEGRFGPRDVSRAIELYAEQAAHGSSSGVNSLLLLVRGFVFDANLDELTSSLTGRSLLGVYLYTRRHELSDSEADKAFAALARQKLAMGASRLAAAAYREGRWDLAGKLALQDPDATLAKWVRAKLALRQGKTSIAEELLADVYRQEGSDDALCDTNSRAQVHAERAIWALKAGRAGDAMDSAWLASENMANYVAERVLNIDELRDFVATGISVEPTDWSQWSFSPVFDYGQYRRSSLQLLFARRLMRTGYRAIQSGQMLVAVRYFSEAAPYFEDDDAPSAAELSKWLLRSISSDDVIVRADAKFRASRILRQKGLETLGTFDAPDWGSTDAQFDMSEYWPQDESDTWIGRDERERLLDSALVYNERYHYRRLASELAQEAAEILPHQSQAYAAVLCHAAKDVFNTDRPRVRQLWNLYVKNGPAVDFSSDFGVRCPQPEFVAARRFLTGDTVPIWLWGFAALCGALALGGAGMLLQKRSIGRGRIGDLDQLGRDADLGQR